MAHRSSTHSLKYQARALASQLAETHIPSWIVGTNALREENEVQVLCYDIERDALQLKEVYAHKHEIWHIAPSPTDPNSLITVYNDGGKFQASLWQLVPGQVHLQEKAELKGLNSKVRSLLWSAQGEQLVSIEESRLCSWQLREGGPEVVGTQVTGEASPFGEVTLWGGAWDPHDENRVATVGGCDLQLWDVRSMQQSGGIPGAHRMEVRDVDFSRQRQHTVVTAGDDCKLRVWDLRAGRGAPPLQELGGHAHWVWQARFNPAHDQLLLSCSSDATVNLWYTPPQPTYSSPSGSAGGGSPATPASGGRGRGNVEAKVHSFEDHEESVYGVAWSTVEPWLFASLSYDGRVVVNRVPNQLKYKILI